MSVGDPAAKRKLPFGVITVAEFVSQPATRDLLTSLLFRILLSDATLMCGNGKKRLMHHVTVTGKMTISILSNLNIV